MPDGPPGPPIDLVRGGPPDDRYGRSETGEVRRSGLLQILALLIAGGAAHWLLSQVLSLLPTVHVDANLPMGIVFALALMIAAAVLVHRGL